MAASSANTRSRGDAAYRTPCATTGWHCISEPGNASPRVVGPRHLQRRTTLAGRDLGEGRVAGLLRPAAVRPVRGHGHRGKEDGQQQAHASSTRAWRSLVRSRARAAAGRRRGRPALGRRRPASLASATSARTRWRGCSPARMPRASSCAASALRAAPAGWWPPRSGRRGTPCSSRWRARWRDGSSRPARAPVQAPPTTDQAGRRRHRRPQRRPRAPERATRRWPGTGPRTATAKNSRSSRWRSRPGRAGGDGGEPPTRPPTARAARSPETTRPATVRASTAHHPRARTGWGDRSRPRRPDRRRGRRRARSRARSSPSGWRGGHDRAPPGEQAHGQGGQAPRVREWPVRRGPLAHAIRARAGSAASVSSRTSRPAAIASSEPASRAAGRARQAVQEQDRGDEEGEPLHEVVAVRDPHQVIRAVAREQHHEAGGEGRARGEAEAAAERHEQGEVEGEERGQQVAVPDHALAEHGGARVVEGEAQRAEARASPGRPGPSGPPRPPPARIRWNVRMRCRSSKTIGQRRAGQVQAMARTRNRTNAPTAFMAPAVGQARGRPCAGRRGWNAAQGARQQARGRPGPGRVERDRAVGHHHLLRHLPGADLDPVRGQRVREPGAVDDDGGGRRLARPGATSSARSTRPARRARAVSCVARP